MTTPELSHSQVGRWADAVALRPGSAGFTLPITLTPQLSLWRLISQGRSIVYEGFDRRAATRVAVKLITRARDEDTRARVLQEAALHANVEHPSIVSIVDVAALSEGTPYVVSELASGEPLSGLVREPSMTPVLACEVVGQVLNALVALHAAGLHCPGLEPGAILLDGAKDGRRRARLLDSSFADLALLDASAVVGAVESDAARLYRAPEQLSAGVINVRTDLYAVGMVLHELLTGSCPHADVAPAELAAKRMRDPIDDHWLVRAGVGSTLSRFVCTALARDPIERFASAEEMLCELHAARADESCLWRLPAQSETVRAVTPEPALGTPVVPLVSVHPKSPLDSAIWTHEEELPAPPRARRAGWKAMVAGFGLTMAAGVVLLNPFEGTSAGSNASGSPVVSVESSPPPAAQIAPVRQAEPEAPPAVRSAPVESAPAASPRGVPPVAAVGSAAATSAPRAPEPSVRHAAPQSAPVGARAVS
ncbi:MAG TPA: protein kinase, partial [Polyangiales bacterium]